jgi:glycine oxidase
MGLMLARELGFHGIAVELLERGAAGNEASWAGGGIISPLYPWRYSEPITRLTTWSQIFYPNLVESLEAESDIDPELSRHGLLMLSVADRDRALEWAQRNQPWIEPVDVAQVYRLEPNLREGFQDALWLSQVASVRTPRLLKALLTIVRTHPKICLRECVTVQPLSQPGGHLDALITDQGERIEADAFVFCAGAWTSGLLPNNPLAIAPVKGQMILFEARPGLVNRIVLRDGKYVLPRRDGMVLAGSTLEHTGFDKSLSETARDELADMAIDLFPALAECRIAHHWSGLRPGSPDEIPFIGRVPEFDNVYLNAGHFRNGLVLAPASVHVMSSLLTGQTPAFAIEDYRPPSSESQPERTRS